MAATGVEVKALQSRPSLPDYLGLFWSAFSDLNTCRAPTMSAVPMPIPWTAIDQWAARHGIAGSQFDRLASHVAAMDSVLIDHYQALDKRNARAG